MPDNEKIETRIRVAVKLSLALILVALLLWTLDQRARKHALPPNYDATGARVSAVYDAAFWAGSQTAMDEVARAKDEAGDAVILTIKMENLVNAWSSNRSLVLSNSLPMKAIP